MILSVAQFGMFDVLFSLPPEWWVIIIAALAIYFYTFMNIVVRRRYYKVEYYDDGEGIEEVNCKMVGTTEIEFYPESIKTLLGVIPLQRRQASEAIRKSISAPARVKIKGPRTFKVYTCTYKSPVTVDPCRTEYDETGMSLGHETVGSMMREASQASRETTKKDWFMMILLLVGGMALLMILQKFIPMLR